MSKEENITTDQIDQLWTKVQVAQYFGVDPKTIENYCAERDFPYIQLIREKRFRKTEVDAWLANRTFGNHQG